MRAGVLLGVGLLLGMGIGCAAKGPPAAKAVLINGRGEQVGTAFLKQTSEGVQISLEVSKLPPGSHAFHIHEVGRCDPPDFKSAGGHFNPYGRKHGLKNPQGAHAGDLPNIRVGPEGTATVNLHTPQVTLAKGANFLLDSDGSALVIHADPDDDRTDPAGNAGARIACGVITR